MVLLDDAVLEINQSGMLVSFLNGSPVTFVKCSEHIFDDGIDIIKIRIRLGEWFHISTPCSSIEAGSPMPKD